MTQKLTKLIQGDAFTASAVSLIRSKQAVWSKASKKAWKVRKRQKKAREAARSQPEAGEMGKEAA